MYVNFEIAALFPSPYNRVKKRGNFKTNTHMDSVESFLYYLSSSKAKTAAISKLEIFLTYRSHSCFLSSRSSMNGILAFLDDDLRSNHENIFRLPLCQYVVAAKISPHNRYHATSSNKESLERFIK